jgi:hypothetical protein
MKANLKKLFNDPTIGKSVKFVYKLSKNLGTVQIKKPKAKNSRAFSISFNNDNYSASPRYKETILKNGDVKYGKIVSFIIWKGKNDKYAKNSQTIICEFDDKNYNFNYIRKELNKL